MSSKSERSKINALLVELVASKSKTRLHRKASKIGAEVEELASLDYAGPLRRCLDRPQLNALIKDARKNVWPNLNREPLRLGSTREFSERFSGVGVEVRPARMPTSTGLALLGFYVRKTDFLSGKPLICVNTAHHPAVIGAAFVHEMGHHLTAEIFGNDDHTPSLLYTGYSDHLNEPSELVADVLVSLGIYPQPMARKMFPQSRRSTRPTNLDVNGHSAVIDYLAKQYGLSFDDKMSVSQKFQYMAGLLHYTRLREALRNEFDL
ncbi:MAG TPA: hypothetical protein VMA09_04915 [Candidatus Binataceae bacterium]|nr:hypothetical protein [Candidatus Binataceae bacterium]